MPGHHGSQASAENGKAVGNAVELYLAPMGTGEPEDIANDREKSSGSQSVDECEKAPGDEHENQQAEHEGPAQERPHGGHQLDVAHAHGAHGPEDEKDQEGDPSPSQGGKKARRDAVRQATRPGEDREVDHEGPGRGWNRQPIGDPVGAQVDGRSHRAERHGEKVRKEQPGQLGHQYALPWPRTLSRQRPRICPTMHR